MFKPADRPRSQRAGTASATANATRDRITSSVGSPATAEQVTSSSGRVALS
jgi:hypothetical protein